MTQSPPKAPPLNIIPFGVRIPTYEFGGMADKHPDHNKWLFLGSTDFLQRTNKSLWAFNRELKVREIP